MKHALPLSIFSFFFFGIAILGLHNSRLLPVIDLTKRKIISCSPYSQGKIDTAQNGKFIVPLPGWSHYSYRISTVNDSAQFYFNQGLIMYYSYHMNEAIGSFKEAARFDSSCLMAYWGQALAMGPNYNSAHTYVMQEGIQEVLLLMNQTISHATVKEKQLIEAMNSRYSAEATDKQRGTLNIAYAREMNKLLSRYPGDQDIKALYIDAMMLIHPWDFWTSDGSAKKWTPELLDLCKSLLRTNPNHPAALHYYIHLTEASRHPEIALGNAEMLKNLFPGVAHMVHMASHEYERNGQYAEGVEINDKADDDLVHYDFLAKNISLNRHFTHYFAVQAYCALSGGMHGEGLRAALRCRNSVSPNYENTYDQYLYMIPILTLVRLGKWEEILRDSIEPDTRWAYAGLLYDFAKGLAFVYKDKLDSAIRRLIQLQSKAKDPILAIIRIPFNSPSQGAGIAQKILNAAIWFAQKKYDTAISCLAKAMQIEDKMIYCEPKDWPIPARQFLGAYLLKLGKPIMAEKVYREDLKWNPGNGWSLIGLCQSLKVQHINAHVIGYRSKYLQSFSHAERIPPASVFMK